ncbi:hypothetical protein VNI00_008790 [Paramarasmius palmivorus]|uniref:Uncharacterized protein n=1 Tax=Paramarasmius palmivorus TaxID=297713 RepID=A0AAW0CWJ8_9AGAR
MSSFRYFTRSVATLVNSMFPDTAISEGLMSGGLLLEDLVIFRHEHNQAHLRNQDPQLRHSTAEDEEQSPECSSEIDASMHEPSVEQSPTDSESSYTSKTPRGSPKRKKRRRRSKLKGASSWGPADPPEVDYQHDPCAPPSQLPSTGSSRKDKRRARSEAGRGIKAESFVAKKGFVDVTVNARVSKPRWAGLNASQDCREEITSALSRKERIPNLTPIPYQEKETKIADGRRRLVIFRSFITNFIKSLMPSIISEASQFISDTTPPTTPEYRHNLRGNHWFCISGYDRNNKVVPKMSRWHEKQLNKVNSYFNRKRPFAQITGMGCSLVRRHFPGIYERYRRCSAYMEANHGFKAPYGGIFFNFCLNGVRAGVDRVLCEPHVDFKNVALGVCMIFIYGHFNHRERCWLVIWEAGIVLELPPGVFLIYPSSLFLHFNIDRAQFLVTEGEPPTPHNSRPLCYCGKEDAAHDQDWQEARGRGSMVWFNQATMFQTSELGYPTVKAAKAAGVDASCSLSADDVFEPVVLGEPSPMDLSVEDLADGPDQDTVDDFW